jgi:hypothetical protein
MKVSPLRFAWAARAHGCVRADRAQEQGGGVPHYHGHHGLHRPHVAHRHGHAQATGFHNERVNGRSFLPSPEGCPSARACWLLQLLRFTSKFQPPVRFGKREKSRFHVVHPRCQLKVHHRGRFPTQRLHDRLGLRAVQLQPALNDRLSSVASRRGWHTAGSWSRLPLCRPPFGRVHRRTCRTRRVAWAVLPAYAQRPP